MMNEKPLFLLSDFCFLTLLDSFPCLRLLRSSLEFTLPLSTTSTSFWPLDNNLLRQLALPPSDLLCSLFLALLIALSESGHGRLEQCPVGRMKAF